MAKNSEATLLLRIKEAGAEALTKVRDGFDEISAKAAAASAVVTGALGLTVAAYADSEKASNALTAAIKAQGLDVDTLKKQYDELAGAIQAKSTYDDDEVTAALAIGQAMAGNVALTKELITATVDYAAATGISLDSAFEKVGKSIGGTTNALAREGLELDIAASKTEKMADVTAHLTAKFDGMAAAQAKGLGSIAQLSNAVGSLSEAVGKELAPYVESAARGLTDLALAAADNKDLVKYGTIIAVMVAGVTGLVGALGGVIALMPALTAGFSVLFGPAGIVIAGVTAIAALGVSWHKNLGEIQEKTHGAFAAIEQTWNAFAEDAVRIFGGIKDVVAGALTLDLEQIKAGISAVSSHSKLAAIDLKKAYEDGFEARKVALNDAIVHEEKAEEESQKRIIRATGTAARAKYAEENKAAAEARADREVDDLKSQIKIAKERKLKNAKTLDEVATAERELSDLIEELHKKQVARIGVEETNKLKAIELVKKAETDAAAESESVSYDASQRRNRIADEQIERAKGRMQGVADVATSAVSQGINGVVGSIADKIPFFGGLIKEMFNLFTLKAEDFNARVKELFFNTSIIENLATNVDTMFRTFAEQFMEFNATIADRLPEIVEQLIEAIIENLPQIIVALVKAAASPEFIEAIIRAIANGVVNGIRDGAAEAGPMISEAFRKAMTDAWNAVKGMFTIGIGGSGGGGGGGITGGDILSGGLSGFFSKGGMVPLYAAGGMMIPKGTDTVPAMLTPGEYVVNAAATARNKGLLESINNGGSGQTANITIVVNGGLLGDAQSARQLAKAIDSELLKLRQSNQSVSFDKSVF